MRLGGNQQSEVKRHLQASSKSFTSEAIGLGRGRIGQSPGRSRHPQRILPCSARHTVLCHISLDPPPHLRLPPTIPLQQQPALYASTGLVAFAHAVSWTSNGCVVRACSCPDGPDLNFLGASSSEPCPSGVPSIEPMRNFHFPPLVTARSRCRQYHSGNPLAVHFVSQDSPKGGSRINPLSLSVEYYHLAVVQTCSSAKRLETRLETPDSRSTEIARRDLSQ